VPILTENIPEVYCIGHDERSAQFQKNIADPLTNCDYKQAPIVAMSTTGGQAYAIGNGQTNQTMTDKVGALNCMHDQIAVLIATPGESSEVFAPTMAEDSTDKMCRTEN